MPEHIDDPCSDWENSVENTEKRGVDFNGKSPNLELIDRLNFDETRVDDDASNGHQWGDGRGSLWGS